ncbi:ABC transporter permease [Roseateles sp.]|uniref:ABC transporter permease n=1 Tax=Roseateles sp. TaxID=1971397 RepID=UPI0025CF5C61|nr:ABC transporter permease [Roseateles sp.]MBV8037775.1 ABC transporter permease [Roseateles sp.]
MMGFLFRRLLQSVLVVAVMSALVFFGVFVIGNPADILIDPEATQLERLEAIRTLGLDQSVWVQYGHFVSNALRGEMGRSFVYNQPALELILERLPATLELATTALLLALLLGVPLGLWAGARPKSLPGRAIQTGAILGVSFPSFWQGLMLVLVFSVLLGWLPSSGRGNGPLWSWDRFSHLILPALNLALFKISLVTRLTANAMREALTMDYIDYARSKGVASTRILAVHALKNVMVPVLTVTGMEFGGLIAFAVVTETVFAWPGMGKLIVDSIAVLDRPVIVAYLMVVVVIFITINLVVDLLYSALDPRVRLDQAR